MPVFYQDYIARKDLRDNPETIYVFGDNTKRVGFGGLAGQCRGEGNAVGVPTKWKPGRSASDFFSDDDFQRCAEAMLKDLEKIEWVLHYGGTVIFPKAPLGSGLSEMPTRCPKLYGFLCYTVALFSEKYGGEPCPW